MCDLSNDFGSLAFVLTLLLLFLLELLESLLLPFGDCLSEALPSLGSLRALFYPLGDGLLEALLPSLLPLFLVAPWIFLVRRWPLGGHCMECLLAPLFSHFD